MNTCQLFFRIAYQVYNLWPCQIGSPVIAMDCSLSGCMTNLGSRWFFQFKQFIELLRVVLSPHFIFLVSFRLIAFCVSSFFSCHPKETKGTHEINRLFSNFSSLKYLKLILNTFSAPIFNSFSYHKKISILIPFPLHTKT